MTRMPGGTAGLDERAEQGVVGAAEDERVGLEALGGGGGEQFVEIDADDLGGDGVAGPAFFDEGDEQGAGLFKRAKAAGLAGSGVGVALHGGVGGDDEHVARCAWRRGRLRRQAR